MLHLATKQQGLPCSKQSLCMRWSLNRNTDCQPSRVQAIMELGATVCTQAPKCADCPIRTHCGAYAEVEQHISSGGSAASAPPVTRFPVKVSSRLHRVASCGPWCVRLTLQRAAVVRGHVLVRYPCWPGAQRQSPMVQQVQKAARKEQRVAVCVVRAADGDGGHSYLLVKRVEKGLLAGAVVDDTLYGCNGQSTAFATSQRQLCSMPSQKHTLTAMSYVMKSVRLHRSLGVSVSVA